MHTHSNIQWKYLYWVICSIIETLNPINILILSSILQVPHFTCNSFSHMVRNLSLLFIIQHFYWTSNQSCAGKATEVSQFYASTMLDWSIQFCFLNVAVCIFYCILWFLLDRLCWLILIRKNIRGAHFNEIKECTSEVVFENRVCLITLQCKSPAPKAGMWTYTINSGIQLREA